MIAGYFARPASRQRAAAGARRTAGRRQRRVHLHGDAGFPTQTFELDELLGRRRSSSRRWRTRLRPRATTAIAWRRTGVLTIPPSGVLAQRYRHHPGTDAVGAARRRRRRQGSLTLNGNGSFAYTPPAGIHAGRRFVHLSSERLARPTRKRRDRDDQREQHAHVQLPLQHLGFETPVPTTLTVEDPNQHRARREIPLGSRAATSPGVRFYKGAAERRPTHRATCGRTAASSWRKRHSRTRAPRAGSGCRSRRP